MFNIKISAIAALAGFVFSFFISLAAGAGMPTLILRPILFAFIFFIVGAGIYTLIQRFLFELLEEDEAGSNLDITIDDDDGETMPQSAYVNNGEFEGLEQHSTNVYNSGNAGDGGKDGMTFADFNEHHHSGESVEKSVSEPSGAFKKLADEIGQDADPKRMAGAVRHLLMDD